MIISREDEKTLEPGCLFVLQTTFRVHESRQRRRKLLRILFCFVQRKVGRLACEKSYTSLAASLNGYREIGEPIFAQFAWLVRRKNRTSLFKGTFMTYIIIIRLNRGDSKAQPGSLG